MPAPRRQVLDRLAGGTPPSRRLVATTVALVLLLGLSGALFLVRHSLPALTTALGPIAPLELVATMVAMAAGGAIARGGFRWIAVALVLAIGLASTASAYALAEQSPPLAWVMRNTALQLALSGLAAWAAAFAGERFAARRRA